MNAPGAFTSADSYEAFALAYDQALGQAFHAVIADRLEELDAKFPGRGTRHLDVACGTGLLLDWGRRRGWRSIGVDASAAMIRLARTRGSRLALGDMRLLPFRERFDTVTCVYDSLNHLLEADELRATFSSIHGVLSREGMLWFDVNHPEAYPRVWGSDDPFEAEGDDWRLQIETSWDRRRRLASAHVTGHAVLSGHRVEIDETHFQRPWSERDIRRTLAAVGLEVVWTRRFEPFGRGGEVDGLKVLYAARPR